MPTSENRESMREVPKAAIIQWPTGSGKTLCYTLPMISRMDMTQCGRGLQGLVLVPTRELAIQTKQTLSQMTGRGVANKKGNKVKVMSLLGDLETMDERTKHIMLSEITHKPPDLAVGTPKMLSQLLHASHLPLCTDAALRTLVLDEVDTLGDSPHWEHTSELLKSKLWKHGAVWLVSAYVSEKLAKKCFAAASAAGSVINPVQLRSPALMPMRVQHVLVPPSARVFEGYSSFASLVKGILMGAKRRERKLLLWQNEKRKNKMRAVVFVSNAEAAARLNQGLLKEGVASVAVHGNTRAKDGELAWGKNTPFKLRNRALNDLEKKSKRVIVATGMLSRGVDIKGATHVINLKIPDSPSDYLHRAGRVGRMVNRPSGGAENEPGVVITLPRTQSEYDRVLGWKKFLGIEFLSDFKGEGLSAMNEGTEQAAANGEGQPATEDSTCHGSSPAPGIAPAVVK